MNVKVKFHRVQRTCYVASRQYSFAIYLKYRHDRKMRQTLRVHLMGDKVSIFSQKASGYQRLAALAPILDRLIHFDPRNSRFVPGLLESWECSENFKLWKLKLKHNLFFHNDRQVSAYDLEHTFGAIITSTLKTPNRTILGNICGASDAFDCGTFVSSTIPGLKVADSRTLLVRLKTPNRNFIGNLIEPVYSPMPKEELIINDKDSYSSSGASGAWIKWRVHPIGAGPYKILRKSADGTEILLERFLQKECEYNWLDNAPKRINILTGQNCLKQTDVIFGARKNPNSNIFISKKSKYTERIVGIYFNYNSKLGRVKDFRKFISKALDKNSIAKAARGNVANSIVPSDMINFETSSVPNAFRSEEGSSFRFPQHLNISQKFQIPFGDIELPNWAKILTRNLKEFGLDIQFTRQPLPASFDKDDKIPFFCVGFIPSVASSTEIFELFNEGGGWVTKLDKPNHLYRKTLNELYKAKTDQRIKLLTKRLHRLFVKSALAVPLFEIKASFYFNRYSVKNINEKGQTKVPYFEKVTLK